MKKLTAYIATILISSPLFAAKISDSQLELGRESAADNKEILFNIGEGTGNPKIRANYSTKKLEFTNDGTNFSEFGTGGDLGGYNIIDNPGFESDLTNWTNTGSGSLSVDTDAADVYQGQKSALFDAAAANDILASEAVTIPGGLRGNLCSVEVQYKGGDDNLKLQAYDGTNVLAEVALEASGNFSKAMVTFTCPSSGTLQGRLIASADAAAINLDNWVVGKSADIIGFSTTKKGSAYLTRTATPQNIPSATETYISWSQLNDSSLDGIWSAGDPTKFVIPASLNGSKVRLSSQLNIDRDASGVSSLVRVTMNIRKNGATIARTLWRNDGTNTFSEWHASVISPPIVVATGDYFEVSIFATFTAGTYSFSESPSAPSFFAIEQIDEAVTSNTVQRVETSAWSVETQMQNATNAGFASSNTKLTGASNLELYENWGNIPAKILCDGAISTGDTCSGVNELTGIVFDAPRAGRALACVSGRFVITESSGASDIQNDIAIVKVAADGSVSAGDQGVTWNPLSHYFAENSLRNDLDAATTQQNLSQVFNLCGVVDLNAGANALATVIRVTANAGSVNVNDLRPLKWTVFPIEQQLPQALITQGKVYYKDCGAGVSVAQNTWTDLNCSLYLPAGTYAIEINAIIDARWSALPTYVAGSILLSDVPTTYSTVLVGGFNLGISRVASIIHQGPVYFSDEVVWNGGTVYLYGYSNIAGGTATSRTVLGHSIKATRLD